MVRLRTNKALSGALAAITAAVVEVVLNLAVWFGLHVFFGTVYALPAVPPDALAYLPWGATYIVVGWSARRAGLDAGIAA